MVENTLNKNQKPLTGVEKRSVTVQHNHNLQTFEHDLVAQEVPIALAYNGQSHAVMMATPTDLNDFAIGFSITERIVDCAQDIINIDIAKAAQGFTIMIHIKAQLMERLEGKRRQLSGRSGCGICGISDLAAAIPSIAPLKIAEPPNHSIIDLAVSTLRASQVLQDQCGAVHCAGLFDNQGQLVCIREDVGRHNALDKLIGHKQAEIDELSCNGHFIVMSSRASHELVAKVAISGINTLVTISAATSLAIDLAEKTKVNLIGFVREKRQIIYAG